ncbi:thiamine phosphate synthase [Bacillus salitolerans]|uniref:Thiamine-phosphate synthase n=1 Tax=Bacillus salitolerans TaxID=1437434 RepID=A0ABW4LWZ2_9BACI
MNIREKLQLYFVMGSPNCPHQNPVEVLEKALLGGITLFQFREKGEHAFTGIAKLELAKTLLSVCHQYGVPFIVNDDIELAIEVNADGVHIGQDDEDIESVRNKLGQKIVGVSAHNLEEAKLAIQKGADYIGVGPMYTTKTKLDAREVQGPQIIKQMREANLTIPIVGIGGITKDNAKEVFYAGADGIAVISAIASDDFPEIAVKELRNVPRTV